MRNKLTFLAGLLLASFLATPVEAQLFVDKPRDAVAQSLTADDTGVAFVLRYIGTAVSGKAVVASGSITLTSGAAGGEAADTTIECPLAAPYGGVLDLTNAACDTVGELADVVNSTAGSKWRIVPVASLRTDVVNARLLADAGASGNTNAPGLSVFWDTSTAFITSVVAFPYVQSAEDKLAFYNDHFNQNGQARPTPFFGQFVQLFSAYALSTYASGTSNLQVYTVDVRFNSVSNKYTEVVSLVYQEAGGATTVAKNFPFANGSGVFGRRNQKVIVRLTNSAAQSAASLVVSGLLYAAN